MTRKPMTMAQASVLCAARRWARKYRKYTFPKEWARDFELALERAVARELKERAKGKP